MASELHFPILCHVRIPIQDKNENDDVFGDTREYRIGRVIEAPDEFGDLLVQTLDEQIQQAPDRTEHRVAAGRADRCRILPNSPCVHEPTGIAGRILIDNGWPVAADQPAYYFVRFNDGMRLLPETELVVGSSRQDPDPSRQMHRREFHHPSWLQSRNRVVGTIRHLDNASYGLAELVSSRVRLLPHQADAITRVLMAPEIRFILADEVGLGKTIEAAVILKALRRAKSDLRVLIVAPGALAFQWHSELDDRFWLRFPVQDSQGIHEGPGAGALDRFGMIVDSDTLGTDRDLQKKVTDNPWDLIVIDEAHQVHKDPALEHFLRQMTASVSSVLLLSATPIERHTKEFIPLLHLLDPEKYGKLAPEQFARLFASQAEVRRAVGALRLQLRPRTFEQAEFAERLGTIAARLEDRWLTDAVTAIRQAPGHEAFELAEAAYSYLSENYRIERRIVRNRRKYVPSLAPVRVLDDGFCYEPDSEESAVLAALLDYLAGLPGDDTATSQYRRLLLNAAASSPHALHNLLRLRSAALEATGRFGVLSANHAIESAGARARGKHIQTLIRSLPEHAGEHSRVQQLELLAERWVDRESIDATAAAAHRGRPGDREGGRLSQVIRAVRQILDANPGAKVLIFSDWPETLDQLAEYLPRITGRRSGVAEFRAGMDAPLLQTAADQFQTDPSCRVLLSDQLGGEGRNFQIANAIIHVDLPWSPGALEQRIGRVDRIGRGGTVTSYVVCARETTEWHLFRLWNEALGLFTNALSGMEIRLEWLQTLAFNALDRDPLHGLADIIDEVTAAIEELQVEIENEQLADQGTVNTRLRANFKLLDDEFRDGSRLWTALRSWSSQAGISPHYDSSTNVVFYSPRSFNLTSMANAQFVTVPNMEEALSRSRRRNDHVVRGTFDREVAVKREDLIFFAPGGEPWTDAVVDNALSSYRGRCCAVLRRAETGRPWDGFEFLFSIAIDPRPVFRLGFDPTALLLGQGFLLTPTYRVLVDVRGNIVDGSGQIGKAISAPWNKTADKHLGKRTAAAGNLSMLNRFRAEVPDDRWEDLVGRATASAWEHVREEFSFLEDDATVAARELAARIHGLAAARNWLAGDLDDPVDLESEQDLANALVAGIKSPSIQLESIRYWMIRPPKETT